MIGLFYFQAIRKLGGCPVGLTTDLGNENGLAASIQSFFSNKIWTHIDMLRRQGTNVLKASGHGAQGKDRISGDNFFKILFLKANLNRPAICKQRL